MTSQKAEALNLILFFIEQIKKHLTGAEVSHDNNKRAFANHDSRRSSRFFEAFENNGLQAGQEGRPAGIQGRQLLEVSP